MSAPCAEREVGGLSTSRFSKSLYNLSRDARCVVRRIVTPGLQRTVERAGDASLAQPGVEPRELGRAAIKLDHVNRFAGRAGFRYHRHRIGGDHNRVGQPEQTEIRIVASSVPEPAGNIVE